MIDKALGLQVAVREAVHNDNIRSLAGLAVSERMTMSEEEMKQVIFSLVGEVAVMASFYSAEVCLGEEGFITLNDTISELMTFEGDN